MNYSVSSWISFLLSFDCLLRKWIFNFSFSKFKCPQQVSWSFRWTSFLFAPSKTRFNNKISSDKAPTSQMFHTNALAPLNCLQDVSSHKLRKAWKVKRHKRWKGGLERDVNGRGKGLRGNMWAIDNFLNQTCIFKTFAKMFALHVCYYLRQRTFFGVLLLPRSIWFGLSPSMFQIVDLTISFEEKV